MKNGFTLIEVAIVLAVLALLIGGMLVPFSAQIEQQKIIDTQNSIDLIKEALIGYAVANGRLPCPAQSATRGEQRTVCTLPADRVGFVPWVTLGTPQLDSWGHLFRYSVSPQFASASQPITLTASPDITILTRDASGNLVYQSNCNNIPAVVLSHGKNGYGAANAQGISQMAPPAANVDEITNAGGATSFSGCASSNFVVSRTQVADAATNGGAFDDIVGWISPYVLFNRMVSAGRLP